MQVLQAIVLGKRQLLLIYVPQILVLDKGIGHGRICHPLVWVSLRFFLIIYFTAIASFLSFKLISIFMQVMKIVILSNREAAQATSIIHPVSES